MQLSARGAKTQVVLGPKADFSRVSPEVDVLVMDAETRHLSPDQAGRIAGDAVARAIRLGIPYIYKKTDSALRGNIGAELEAVMKAAELRQLPFLPAFPRMARVTRNGIHYIDSVPVNESVFGQDPFEPVRHAEVAALIGEQSSVPVLSLPAGSSARSSGILVYDAVSDDDLQKSGKMLQQTGGLSITAGCAGFGAVLSDLLDLKGKRSPLPHLQGHFLMLCGSVNPITLQQMKVAEESGFARFRLTPAEKLTPGFFAGSQGREVLARMRRMLDQNQCMIVDTNDMDGNGLTKQYAEEQTLTPEEVRTGIAASLGTIMAGLFNSLSLGTLLITGGDTLLECMKAVGIHEMEPLGELFPGVVLSRFSHHGHTRFVISKSGGFGEPDLLVKIAARLSREQIPERRAVHLPAKPLSSQI